MNARPESGGRPRRIAGLVRKEALQIARDPSSYLIAGVLPLLLLVLFGYGVSLDLMFRSYFALGVTFAELAGSQPGAADGRRRARPRKASRTGR